MNARRRSLAMTLPAILGIAVIQACATPPASTPSAPVGAVVSPSAPPASKATAPAPTASPMPPAHAAPVELQGKWSADLGPNDQATLRISETVFLIYRGGVSITGKIAVDGDMITFFDSPQCVGGTGTYRWAIAGDVLTLTSVGDRDPCPRSEILGKELKRVPS